MNLKSSLAVCLTLLFVGHAQAGQGFWQQLGRYLGYGIGDGYHANLDCGEPGCTACAAAVTSSPGADQEMYLPAPTPTPALAPTPRNAEPVPAPPAAYRLPAYPQPVWNSGPQAVQPYAGRVLVAPTAPPAMPVAPASSPNVARPATPFRLR